MEEGILFSPVLLTSFTLPLARRRDPLGPTDVFDITRMLSLAWTHLNVRCYKTKTSVHLKVGGAIKPPVWAGGNHQSLHVVFSWTIEMIWVDPDVAF